MPQPVTLLGSSEGAASSFPKILNPKPSSPNPKKPICKTFGAGAVGFWVQGLRFKALVFKVP